MATAEVRNRRQHVGRFQKLTNKQLECAIAATSKRTYREIAADLGLSESAVRNHLKAAGDVLGVRTRGGIAEKLIEYMEAVNA